jgi:acyl carrier protein
MVGARVEADAVLGHQVTLESEVVVGEGAVVLSGARVPRGTKIAAGGRWPQPMPSTEIRSEASASDLLPLLSQWIAEIVDAPMPALSAETDIVKDAGLDSLALTQLAARVRQRFHVQMRAVEFSNDLRLGRLAALVAERIAAAGK